jgi:hypothetical protein
MNSRSIFEVRDNIQYREYLLDTLCSNPGFKNSDFRDLLEYVLDKKLDLFNKEDFKGTFYDGEDNILDLVLPSIVRLYGNFFIKPPTILKDNKLELFQLSFDIDDFIDYFIDMIPKMKYSLVLLENIDRTNETLSLIVDNYVGIYFNNSYNCDNVEQEIREVKLKKLV